METSASFEARSAPLLYSTRLLAVAVEHWVEHIRDFCHRLDEDAAYLQINDFSSNQILENRLRQT